MTEESGGPPFPIGGPTSTSWREHALSRVGEQRFLTHWFESHPDPSRAVDPEAFDMIHRHLNAAKEAAEGTGKLGWRGGFKSLFGGAPVERAMSNLDAAEGELLRVAPEEYVRGQMPNLVAHIRAHLPANDPRRERAEKIASAEPNTPLNDVEKDAVVGAVRIGSLESRREVTRVRSFRNVLLVTAAVLALVMAGVVVLGVFRPDDVPLCFAPGDVVVCPTSVEKVPGTPTGATAAGQARTPDDSAVDAAMREAAAPWDVPLVALLGLTAAAVAAAVGLRNIQGTITPYSLPVALAVLKLPTGALTGVLGILLMRGEFIPGLSALDSPAQILSWAIVLGYAQQLLTRFVDQQAHEVLADVGGGGNRPASPAAQQPPSNC
ncbi:MAG: hypothetical protein QOI64_416 [Solirubrobacteraceae bacterium]|nr:hypothetical protein [Solirubrobacteraceae bacterium]